MMPDTTKKEIMKLHNLVVSGLVNGLSHTATDGRTNDIDFWRKRARLFGAFSRCVLNIVTDQDYQYDLMELKEIAEAGYKNE